MKRLLMISLLTALSWQTPVMAQADVSDPVVQMVEKQGYTVTEVTRTWLGRILITAQDGTNLREVVLNRRNGQILRDQLFPLAEPSGAPATPAPASNDVIGTVKDTVDSATGTVDGVVGGTAGAVGGAVGGIGLD